MIDVAMDVGFKQRDEAKKMNPLQNILKQNSWIHSKKCVVECNNRFVNCFGLCSLLKNHITNTTLYGRACSYNKH